MQQLSVVRRRLWIIVAFVVITPVIAVAVSLSMDARYEASSTVLISRQSLANQLNGGTDATLQQQSFQQMLTTQARLARTPSVLEATVSKARVSTPLTARALKDASTVKAEPATDLLLFAVQSDDPADARRLAVAYADAYVAFRRTLDSSALTRALQDVNRALSGARKRGRGADALVNRLSTSKQELETRLALQTSNAQVVAGPDEATKVQPKPLRAGVLGLVLGLAMGVMAALLRHALDTRVRSVADAEDAVGLPILAQIGRPKGSGGAAGTAGVAMLEDPRSQGAEAFRILRTNLSFGVLAHRADAVMVTSATLGEGKSVTIANLAVASAMAGQRVALVDLDLRRPRQAAQFGVPVGHGLTGVVVGDTDLDAALQEIELPTMAATRAEARDGRLTLLTSGPLPPDPSEFIGTDAVRTVIDQLKERFDLVLVDAPPIVAVSDTSIIARYVDAIFVCVRLDVARRPAVREMTAALQRVSTPVLGQVVTGVGSTASGYYGYGYTGVPAVDAETAGVAGVPPALATTSNGPVPPGDRTGA